MRVVTRPWLDESTDHRLRTTLLVLNSKTRIQSCRLEADFLNLLNPGPLRPGYEIFLKLLDVTRRAFSNYFHDCIRTVAHITQNLMARRGALRKEAITHSLHVTAYQKLPRHLGYMHLKTLPELPRFRVNVSRTSLVSANLTVRVIVSPLIEPE